MVSSDVKYLWPSTVNVANFVTVKPCFWEDERSNNFSIWKEQMLCLLESQDLLRFINGEIPPPEMMISSSPNVESEQMLMWRRSDRLVKGWILGSIGKDALDAVWKLETARDVWLALEKIFNEEESSESGSDVNVIADDKEDGSENVRRYLPLYKAALRGDWDTAKKKFFDKDNDATTAIVSYRSETALHSAVLTGKANDFVKKLLELLPPEALVKKTFTGNTALHYAAVAGNTEAAIALVTKNPDLLYILNGINRLPVHQAAIFGHKQTLMYLMSMAKPNVEHSPFEGQLDVTLLFAVIASEFFDVALDLVDKHPDLAKCPYNDDHCALSCLTNLSSVFPSGERFSWWQKLIYHCIPLKQPKGKAAQATSAAVDIENVCRDAPAYLRPIAELSQKLEFLLWKVIEHLVPQVKDIRNKKAAHVEAIELVKRLCQIMVSLPGEEASILFGSSMIKAAMNGISEIVEVIMEMYPSIILGGDSNGRNVFFLAASNRFENVFNLIYNMSDIKYWLSNAVDDQGNNLMHVCAKLAPPDRLNLVPGAALEMQRELQWFKEMEKFVRPSRRIWPNDENKTPKMIFTEEHQQLKREGEKWMKDTSNACTIAAALIATVVFAAAFTVPGGIAPDSGIPIFWDQFAFILFAVSDAVSMFTSVTSLLMFLSILTSRYAEEDFLYVLPKRLSVGLLSLFISITFMMAAFSATVYLVFRRKVAWFLIPVAAFACLPVTSFVLLQFPLLVDVVSSTCGPGIFGKKSDRLLY